MIDEKLHHTITSHVLRMIVHMLAVPYLLRSQPTVSSPKFGRIIIARSGMTDLLPARLYIILIYAG